MFRIFYKLATIAENSKPTYLVSFTQQMVKNSSREAQDGTCLKKPKSKFYSSYLGNLMS